MTYIWLTYLSLSLYENSPPSQNSKTKIKPNHKLWKQCSFYMQPSQTLTHPITQSSPHRPYILVNNILLIIIYILFVNQSL